jgi:hypothetical protein
MLLSLQLKYQLNPRILKYKFQKDKQEILFKQSSKVHLNY